LIKIKRFGEVRKRIVWEEARALRLTKASAKGHRFGGRASAKKSQAKDIAKAAQVC
jgi:hypothetical protein